MSSKTDLSYISSIDALYAEQRKVAARIKMQEDELRAIARKIPGRLLRQGAQAVVPPLMETKATSSILSAGGNVMGALFSKDKDKKKRLFKAAGQTALYFLLRQGIRIFTKL